MFMSKLLDWLVVDELSVTGTPTIGGERCSASP
jgi:hypothetical protein